MSQFSQTSRFMQKVTSIRRLMIGDDAKPVPDAAVLLEDLRIFCHADATTHCFDQENRSDPLASAQLEGRRQVWLRLSAYLEMSEKDLSNIGQTLIGGEDE